MTNQRTGNASIIFHNHPLCLPTVLYVNLNILCFQGSHLIVNNETYTPETIHRVSNVNVTQTTVFTVLHYHFGMTLFWDAGIYMFLLISKPSSRYATSRLHTLILMFCDLA